ncbi:hypothetical protein [Streptomyces sp. NPDC093105]|uniref:hypothetical protein n=1 Tax=Streptomyces sp. NPDC093105 TaxID=3366029 RepID=UPI003822D669
MRTALRTALAAALVAGVAATPVLASGTAFAAGPAPAPKPAAAAPAGKTATPAGRTATTTPGRTATTTPGQGAAAGTAPAADADTPVRTVQLVDGLTAKVYRRGDQHPYYTATIEREGATLGELKAGAGYPAKDTRIIVGHVVTLDFEGQVTATAIGPDGHLLRTVQLAGGLSAEVYARGDQHPYYTATVHKDGRTLGELKAGAGYPPKETKVFAGHAVTLDFEGTVTAVAVDTATGTLVRTQTLVGGTVAKIYKVNAQHHRAELFRDGRPVGELTANTRPAAGNDNGEFLVLNPDGTTHNWVGNYRPGATPGIYRLADGTVLELTRKDGRYGLQLIENDKGRGFTYLNGDRAVWTYGKAVVVLERDGGFAAYIPGSARQAAPQPYGMGGGGQGEERPADTDPDALGACTVTRWVDIGAGTGAKLIMSPKGPKAKLITAGDDKVIAVLDRAHPALPKSAGIVARLVDAHTATPSLYTRTQGGGAKGGTHAFPKLPKGCELNAVPGAQGQDASPQGGQTSVIPKGGVAAGAEPTAEESSATLVAIGAGAASLAAAGLGFTALRRRTAGARG